MLQAIDHRPAGQRRAFTIIELLVVIGIIVLLAGILLPMLFKARNSATRTRIAADLNTVATALDAYKQDFGDYPRVDVVGTGFAVLGKALGSPYGDGLTPAGLDDLSDPKAAPMPQAGDCQTSGGYTITPTNTKGSACWVAKVSTPTGSPGGTTDLNSEWAQYGCLDGADGAGFRLRSGGAVHRAYLEAGRLKFRGLAVLDLYEHPILYFPQNPYKVNLSSASSRLVEQSSNTSIQTMYDFDANGSLFKSMTPDAAADGTAFTRSLARMQVMMGDVSDTGTGAPDGKISAGNGETAATTGPFILWSAGADGLFGPATDVSSNNSSLSATDRRNLAAKADDVTNFNVGQ